jgi:hypothetical protein
MKFHSMASAVVLFLVSTAAFAQDSKAPQGASKVRSARTIKSSTQG